MTDAILLALAPVFFVLLLGYGAGRYRVVENHHVDGLNALVMSFALPAALFVATAQAPRREMLAQAPMFAIFGGMMLVVSSPGMSMPGATRTPPRPTRRCRGSPSPSRTSRASACRSPRR